MPTLDDYRQQSPITDPGEFAPLYDELPDDIAELYLVAQRLIVHYAKPDLQPTADRLREIDSRYLTTMLGRIRELDARPLTEARPIESRLVGCCRDFTALLVSILRHKGVPARARYGVAAYFEPGWYHDHVILEFWNGARWVGVDGELSPEAVAYFNIQFDPLDVPGDQFLRAGVGWQRVRDERADSERFGLGSQSPLRGLPILVTELQLDLAALNQREMLCWDSWGITRKSLELDAADLAFLDEVARATLDETQSAAWARLYQDERLRIPPVIESYSPALTPNDMPTRVKLRDTM